MKRSIPSRKISRVLIVLAVFSFCIAATFLSFHKLHNPLTGIDDANIYFVYARNLASGHGFVYNSGGEKVEGFTSLLWTVISAMTFKFFAFPEFILLMINVVLVSLGIACAAGFLLHMPAGEGETQGTRFFWLSLFLVLVFTQPRYVVWNTVTLMENALWSTLLLLTSLFVIQNDSSPRQINTIFLPLAILLILTRPESLVWVAVFLFFLFLRLVFTVGFLYALKILAPSAVVLLIVLALLTAFRLSYFGYPLPNTYYAKVSPSLAYNFEQGSLYLVRYIISDPVVSISVLAIFVACLHSIYKVSPATGEFYLPFIAATGLLVPLLIGGDHFGSFRFYQNVYPITLLCLIYIVRVLFGKTAGKLSGLRTFVFPALAIVLLYGFGVEQKNAWSSFPTEIQGEFDIARSDRIKGDFIQGLFSSLPRLPSVGVIAAGGIKYAYAGEIVDLVGLNNTVMAHNHGNRVGYKGHAAFEVETFFKLKPEIVLPFMVDESWQYDEQKLKERWENRLAFKGLFDEPRFLTIYQYAKICKSSQAGCKTALIGWYRRDFLESLMADDDFSVARYEYAP
jgi:arabinofuranosyltransferase